MHKFTLAIHNKMMYIEMQKGIQQRNSYFNNTFGGYRYERKSNFSVFRRS